MKQQTSQQPNIFPSFRYKDAPKALAWLGRALGFEKHFVVRARTGASLTRNSSLARA